MIRYGKRAQDLVIGALVLAAAACLGPGDITGDQDDVVLTGTINVVTVTTGAGSDPNGYLAMLNEELTQPIDANAVVSFFVPVGSHHVRLEGVDLCTVTTENPVLVTVLPDSTVTTQFDVDCP